MAQPFVSVPNYHFLELPQNILGYITDKNKSSKSYFRYLLSRTQMMFKYTNLPETIPANLLERMLQVNGVACITEASIDTVEPSLYCFSGNIGGELDEYYRPTRFIVSNPHLGKEGFFKECIVNGSEEHTGVLMYNDTEWQGLTPLISRYASLMCENVLTVRVADIMLRKMDIIVAKTDKTKKSADLFLKKLENGELAAMTDSQFLEAVNVLPSGNYNGSYVIQFIELQQYLKGSFYNELGLRANYNMKREAIGEGESTLDADSVLPLCENMLNCRREAVSELNKLYGLDVSVDYNSAWLENHIDSYLSIYNKIAEAAQMSGATPVSTLTNSGAQGDVKVGESGAQLSQVGESVNDDRDNGENREASEGSASKDESNRESADGNIQEAGEDRRESGSGVGKSLEGTGQDEELIELEEVVEKMIDNVYDEVVNGVSTLTDESEGDNGSQDSEGSEDSEESNESEVKKDET